MSGTHFDNLAYSSLSNSAAFSLAFSATSSAGGLSTSDRLDSAIFNKRKLHVNTSDLV